MSYTSVDPALIFGEVLDFERFLLSGGEEVASIFEDEPFYYTTPDGVVDSASPANTDSPREECTPEPAPSPQPAQVVKTYEMAAPVAKPVANKRKAWGQDLPIPTTNLPPRKRAKTAEEKEQRRIERVLRNRAAAQSSRERKQKEVLALEDERARLAESNAEMRTRLMAVEEANKILGQQLQDMRLTIKLYEESMMVASEITATTFGLVDPPDTTPYFEVPRSTDQEEDILQFFQCSQAAAVTTIDPTKLLAA